MNVRELIIAQSVVTSVNSWKKIGRTDCNTGRPQGWFDLYEITHARGVGVHFEEQNILNIGIEVIACGSVNLLIPSRYIDLVQFLSQLYHFRGYKILTFTVCSIAGSLSSGEFRPAGFVRQDDDDARRWRPRGWRSTKLTGSWRDAAGDSRFLPQFLHLIHFFFYSISLARLRASPCYLESLQDRRRFKSNHRINIDYPWERCNTSRRFLDHGLGPVISAWGACPASPRKFHLWLIPKNA